MSDSRLVREALSALDVDQFVLGVHDPSFPVRAEEDPGRGSPYADGAMRLFEYASALGFNGIQLGPQGATHPGSASPYEATLFSRNPLNLPLRHLVEDGLLSAATADAIVARRPEGARERMPYAEVFAAYREVTAEVTRRGLADPSWRALARSFLAANDRWLVRDALYDILCRVHGHAWWREWGHTEQGRFDMRLFHPYPGDERRAQARIDELRATHADELEGYALLQALLFREHEALRARVEPLGLALYGDLQVGYSAQDTWSYQSLFLRSYRMGAPPSRTNPDGQPWGYTVLDPARYGTRDAPGEALEFVRARVDHMLVGADGVRVDHPHGWIDPWVYRADEPDALRAVQRGARLFSSPDVADHPGLASFSIARPDQLDTRLHRYADGWVHQLGEAQVARYAVLVDTIVDRAREHGRDLRRMVCEVLSTLPYPVARVLERHGLGRFRVMQKAKLDDPADVYRSENAQPADWIMLGNHDTPSIWKVVETWASRGELSARARHVAARISPAGADPEVLAQRLVAEPGKLANALLAEALLSRARNVFVFFPDLFGQKETYNLPGTVSEENWTLRVPPDFEVTHAERAGKLEALNVRWALALALRARGGEEEVRLADALSPVVSP